MNPDPKPPKGRGVIWMRRIANFGFAISALYFVYLVAILVVSSKINSEFEGQPLGDVEVEFNIPPLVKAPVFDATRGKKQVVVLWATWCGPCHSLLMDLKEEVEAGRLAKESVLAVSMAEPLKDVDAYLAQWQLPFRVALDPEGNLAKRVKLQGTPTVMFLDENGVIERLTTGGFGLSGKIADFAK